MPQTLDHLEDNIRRVIADIRPQMLEKVIENGTSRLDYIRASRGSPMPEIIFKIPLVRLVEGEERWEASDHPQIVLPLNWGGTEPNRTDTCMMLKATAYNRRHLALCYDEFHLPRSGICRSDGIGNNNNLTL
ncbi:uncharacterized protein TNCV_1676711 [Trichonephila clavipes]|nr:uncharacterized protein TNCV_1676711 [Trichonephila clavipes]